jgi:soluble lytic murein transglycosylase-like protein
MRSAKRKGAHARVGSCRRVHVKPKSLASSQGNLGLMQIRHATARGMGYRGSAAGLLDANTNLTYAVPYLASAYRVAGGNAERALSLYASGYYYEAKRKGLVGQLRTAITPPPAGTVAQPAGPTMSPWLSQTHAPAGMQVLPASNR